MTKNILTALIVSSLCLSPVMAFAQSAPPAEGAPPPPPMTAPGPNHHRDFAKMRQMREAFERVHREERAKILAALTPAHRQLLANIVGGMAIASRPDFRAAAARLDAALSPSEKAAILADNHQAMEQMRNIWQQARAQSQPPSGQPKHPRHEHKGSHHAPSAGAIALMVAGGHGGPPMMGPHR